MTKHLWLILLIISCTTAPKFNYEGDVNDNGLYHGKGVITYSNGEKWVGEFKDGDPYNGQATYNYSDGGKYVGEYKDNKQNSLVRSFLGAIRSKEGTPRFKRKTGTADMNILAKWRCPIVAYGPGDSALDHTVNEHLYLAEYEQSIKVLTNVLEKLERM
jgi:acetylornithine deacetylase/succinyl-diaminopimelate desuccinylase-like protein